MTSAPTHSLTTLIENAPLVVCLGPGGVGKTTLSSVLALRQASLKKRALVLTVDPARRLADALGVGQLTNDPVEVASFSKMHPGGTLSALMLEPSSTFDHLISMLVLDHAKREALFGNSFYQHISRSLAGTLEYMAVERLYVLRKEGGHDAIVLDTPPTTNALDLLEAPERLSELFSDKVVRWFMPAESRALSLTARIFNRAGSTALSLLSKVAGESFVEETVGFFGAFGDLFSHFRQRGQEVGKLLRDANTAFLLVCSPEQSRIDEALELDRRLTESGCKVRGFVVNRVVKPLSTDEGELSRAVSRATELLGEREDPARARAFIERLEALRARQEETAKAHASLVASLERRAGARPVFTAPAVPLGESPRAALLALYLGLFSEEPGQMAGLEHEAQGTVAAKGRASGKRAMEEKSPRRVGGAGKGKGRPKGRQGSGR